MPWKSASFIGVVLTYFPPPYQTENEVPALISNDRISLVVNFYDMYQAQRGTGLRLGFSSFFLTIRHPSHSFQ
jgi:hypothetical protein